MFLRDSHQNQMQQFYSNHGDHHPANAEVKFSRAHQQWFASTKRNGILHLNITKKNLVLLYSCIYTRTLHLSIQDGEGNQTKTEANVLFSSLSLGHALNHKIYGNSVNLQGCVVWLDMGVS
jgi:hypothetical protein